MVTGYRKDESRVIIGVDFSDSSKNFLKSAADFARALSVKVTLFHVYEPYTQPTTLVASPYLEMNAALFDNMKESLNAQMEDAKKLFEGLDVETKIEMGLKADSLIRAAEDQKAYLIIVGSDSKPDAFFPDITSTAYKLASNSTCSTMIIPSSLECHFGDEKWRLLVGDDFKDRSTLALILASELCTSTAHFELHHFHSHKQDKKSLQETGEKILTAMMQRKIPYDESFTSERYLNQIAKELEAKMDSRMGTIKTIIDNLGAGYFKHIRYGSPKESLYGLTKEVNPHVIVLGRHEAIHTKPFALGKIPFNALVHSHKPVIIAI